MRKNKIIKENGITLVALVITVIILIILAGVSLNLALGQNGIFVKSKEAVDKYKDEAQKEQNTLENIYQDMQAETGGNDQTAGGWTYYPETKKTADGKATIPGGYYLSNDNNNVDKGLVIKDENDNEWVWVPVSNEELKEMYTTGEYTINEQKGTKYSILYTYTENDRTAMSDGNPENENHYREPGYSSEYDNNEKYYGTGNEGAGFSSSTEMTKAFIDDYDALIQSIQQNGGFYIGRYELGKENEKYVVKKYISPVNEINWYQAYRACRSFSKNTTTSTMIWGTQFDRTIQWLQSSGYDVYNAKEYGNYITSSLTWKESEEAKEKIGHRFAKVEEKDGLYIFYDEENNVLYTFDGHFTKAGIEYRWNNTGFYEDSDGNKFEDNGIIIPTGSSEQTKTNNIYDLAGNLHEWTQEANDSDGCRVGRGGWYRGWGDYDECMSYRFDGNYPNYGCDNWGARATLYIN